MSIIYLLLVFLAFYVLQNIIYEKHWNRNLKVEAEFKNTEIFEGESTEIIETLKNNKWLPVWWINMQIPISRYLIFTEEEELKPRPKESSRKDFYTLLSYEKVTQNIKITALRRGYYKIDEFSIGSGDLFSQSRFLQQLKGNTSLCVYPRIIDTPMLNIFLNKLSGEVLTKRHIIEDPFTFRGIRDYTVYDSLKLVNWNATARTGDMKVNQYDYTISQETMIILNTERFNQWDNDVLLEESIRLAASISADFIKNGVQVGIKANSLELSAAQEVDFKPRSGSAQLYLILDVLAKLQSDKITRDIKDILEQEKSKIKRAYNIVFISYYYDEGLYEKFSELKDGGVSIQWIVPALKGEKVKLQSDNKIFIWEVSEDERRIF